MDEAELQLIIEALLLSSNEPLTSEKLMSVFDEWQKPTLDQVNACITALIHDYHARPIELIQSANGYRMQTKIKYSHWISRLQAEKPVKYSRALLETLAVIAYKQPVTRADIEEIRGVTVSSQIIKTLMEREWIRIAGYKDVVGKPAVYTTTVQFLNYFNLQYLHELPTLPEIMESLALPEEGLIIEECIQNE